jgi:hypothetical protein
MASSRFLKSPKLSVVLQVTETTTADTDGRSWEVHDVERSRGFLVTLSRRTLTEPPAGRASIGRPFTDAEVDGAMGLAIERALVTPPEKVPGPLYDVPVEAGDLYDFAGR